MSYRFMFITRDSGYELRAPRKVVPGQVVADSGELEAGSDDRRPD